MMVFTPDKKELRLNIQRSGTREPAIEMVREKTAEMTWIPAPSRRLRELIAVARRSEFYERQNFAPSEKLSHGM